VTVAQSGTIDAGGDGIVATSEAAAGAKVAQSANQTNSTDLNIDTNGPRQETGQVAGSGPNGGQSNTSYQDGFAEAKAASGEVVVTSQNDPAGGDGIVASSAAAASAVVDQSVFQENENTNNFDDVVALNNNGPLGGQVNSSEQSGTAFGKAFSDKVSVTQSGRLDAGGDGIKASSSAVAQATVKQRADQANATDQANGCNGGGCTSWKPGLMTQHNQAGQRGMARALAKSDSVSVLQKGKLTAGGTGIQGVSAASATAKVDQNADQSNNLEPEYGDLEDKSDFEKDEKPIWNRYWNAARTAATAVAEQVGITSDRVNAGGDGVVGLSSATATALGGNAGKMMRFPMAAETDQLQSQNKKGPLAFAYAKADKVNIVTEGTVKAQGNGVYAMSYANANAQASDNVYSAAEAQAPYAMSAAVAKSDDVNVTVKGDVTAGKTGVYAGSVAEANANNGKGLETEEQGNVSVTVEKGTVKGGNGYYGVAVVGGKDNTVSIGKKGTVTSASKHAIYGGTGNETVDNSGMVIGDVDLDGGTNAFNNKKSGSFYTGSTVDLNGGLLTNSGLLSPGGPGPIKTTNLNGSLAQTGTGKYAVDIDQKNAKSDRIKATGTASLKGEVLPTIVANPKTGNSKVTILSAAGGASTSAKVKDTALVDYSVKKAGSKNVELRMKTNFAPKGLSKEANSVGQSLNSALAGGSKNFEKLGLALVNVKDLSDVAYAYEQLDGENYRALPISTLYAAEQFHSDMMSCPEREDGTALAFIDEDQCVFARVRFGNLDVDANAATRGFSEDAYSITGGAQWTLNGPWHASVAAGYEDSDISTNGPRLSSDGDRFHLGGSLKYIEGSWFFGGTLAAGWTSYDTTRQVSFPGFADTLRSDQDVNDFGGQFRAAYLMTSGTWYAKPLVDFNLTYVDMDGFRERGGAAALRFASADETVFSATPALELGTQMGLGGGMLVRPFVRGGVSFYSDDDFPFRASFAGSSGVTPFTTTGEIDDVIGNVSAGLTLLGVGKGSITLNYDGRFGDDVEDHAGAAKASWRF
jgi:outer membrane autotransporter protein